MNRLLRMVIPLVLTISLWGNAIALQPEELTPLIKAIGAFGRGIISGTMTQVENQFFENEEVFIQSADALREITDGSITYESRTTDTYAILSELETVNKKQLYVLSKKELPEEQMELLRKSGALDVFSKTGCRRIDFDEDYTMYWWDMPVLMVAGGIIHIKNRDGLESWYRVQKELDDSWVTFLYTSI